MKLHSETIRHDGSVRESVGRVDQDSPIGRMFVNSTTQIVKIINHLGEERTFTRVVCDHADPRCIYHGSDGEFFCTKCDDELENAVTV